MSGKQVQMKESKRSINQNFVSMVTLKTIWSPSDINKFQWLSKCPRRRKG